MPGLCLPYSDWGVLGFPVISARDGVDTMGDLLWATAHLARALVEKSVLPEGMARGFLLQR